VGGREIFDLNIIHILTIILVKSFHFKIKDTMELFKNFDFNVLNNRDYKEDAVREDIVAPLLKELGFQPSGENLIIRSKSLLHPFVHIGTKQHKVNIIPDYLLQVNGKYVFTLDAKAPNEDIKKGANVEQAFSYSIHPEIRSFLYGLCNGREICIYQWTKLDPILTIPIQELKIRWEELYRVISPIALTKPHLIDFLPDFGLSWYKMGVDKGTEFLIAGAWVNHIVKLDDNNFTIASEVGHDNEEYLASFDFSKDLYNSFLKCVPEEIKAKIIEALSKQPYYINLSKEDSFEIFIHAKFGYATYKNEDEEYFPLIVEHFDPISGSK
jgi:Type I restriction enzyme R protein N terminus (HSDR_N)